MTHDPLGRGSPPHPVVKPLRRLKAFRLPENYVYDALRGYQGDADKFSIFRIRLGTIPLDAKLVFIKFDHTKHDAYICIEHPSFPEYRPGALCEEIKIELEVIEVARPNIPREDSPKENIAGSFKSGGLVAEADGTSKTPLETGDAPAIGAPATSLTEYYQSEGVTHFLLRERGAALSVTGTASTRLGAGLLLARSRARGCRL